VQFLVLLVGGLVWGYDPPRKNLLLRNCGGSQDPHRVAAPVKKKKKSVVKHHAMRTYGGVDIRLPVFSTLALEGNEG
jgi:hypothetical protein